MLKSQPQPPAERNDTSRPMSVTANVQTKTLDTNNSGLGIGHKENQLPNEVADSISMTVGEGHFSEATRLNDEENDDDRDTSENIDFAVSLMEQCIADLSLPNLDNIIFLFHQVLEQCSPTHPLHFYALRDLASALGFRFLHTKDQADFIESLTLGRNMQEDKPALTVIFSDDDNSDTKEILEMAQTSLVELRKSIALSTINTVIFLLQQALAILSPGHPKRHFALTNLAYGMYIRFHHSNNISDVNRAISILESHGQVYSEDKQDEIGALQEFLVMAGAPLEKATVNPDRKQLSIIQSRGNSVENGGEDVSLLRYAASLIGEFDTSGNINDLEHGIALMQSGLTEISVRSPNYTIALNSLAIALETRFKRQGDAEDLDASISFHRQALELRPSSHPLRYSSLNNLAIALWTRFNLQGDAQDINECITFHRQVLVLCPPPDPRRSTSLNNLGLALWTRFDQRGEVQDLDESISFYRQALKLCPFSHPDRSALFNNLANSLFARFKRRGDAQDLDESITFHRQALELFPPLHPNRSSSLSNLAATLWMRAEQRGDVQDLDEAIEFLIQGLKFTPPSDQDRPGLLHNLALILRTKFEQRGNSRDLDASISFHRQTLELCPPLHHLRPGSLNDLANALYTRFKKRGDPQDIDESISFHRQALVFTPPSNPNRSSSLSNLAAPLWTRFEERGDVQDLDEALASQREALELTPLSHQDRPGSLHNLAVVLSRRFEKQGDASHLEEAMSLFSEATDSLSQSSSGRFRNAKIWAHYADLHDHPSAIKAFDIALGILPELAALGLDIQSRQDTLTQGTDGIARKAGRYVIRIGNLDKAIEFLETGRSVFWSQFLSLRSPFDRLDEVAPQLAKDLRGMSAELEKGSHRNRSIGSTSNLQRLSWEEEAKRFKQLAQEWKTTVDKVRNLDGFVDFLQPQKLSKLQVTAKRGPIIYLVANNDTSNCLIMTSTHVHHIPLPNLPIGVLSGLVQLVRIAASDYQVPRSVIEEIVGNRADLSYPVMGTLQRLMDQEEERGMRQERRVPGRLSSDDIFKGVLRILWNEAVKPVIDFLGLKKSSKPPTLTWCTTGWFTFLPIHAAGYYNKGLVDCASDYIISSYTPTIGALLTSNPPSVESFKMMAVIESSSLPSTREELKRIERHIAGDSLIKFGTPNAPASVEAVASGLSTASIIHFACHGKQDLTNPLKSGLEIGHERLTISRIMKESVPNGSLAFLSACETAMGDEKIPDEAMSIGASLLFTGFRSVVATMWRMWDQDGPVIADAFYRELFKGPDGKSVPQPNTNRSAEALAIAVNELRTSGVPFKRWVPFIHMGK